MDDGSCNDLMPPPLLPVPSRKIVFRRCPRSANGTFAAQTDQIDDTDIDAESARRRFGWTTVMLAHIPQHLPFIFRQGEPFCSTRMFESSIINNQYHIGVQEHVLKFCTQATIQTHTITVHEAVLLNEINAFHCDSQYGSDKFTVKDTIIRISDAIPLARFAMIAGQLAQGMQPSLPTKRFGLIRVDKSGVVPYVVAEDQVTYVPVCFFSDDHSLLRTHKTVLGGWDLPFLKLAALIMNVGMDLFTEDTCPVVDLNVVRKCFPAGTTFEEYWPVQEALKRFLCHTRVSLAWLRVVPYVEHVHKDDADDNNVEIDPLEIRPSDLNSRNQQQWYPAVTLQPINIPHNYPNAVGKPEAPQRTYLKRKT